MKLRFVVSGLVLALAGCGRSSMETCAQGSEACQCYDNGACNPGLLCVADFCQSLASSPAPGAGGVPDTGGQLGSGGMVGSGGLVGSGGMVGSGGSRGSGGVIGMGGTKSGPGGSGGGGVPGSGGTTAAVTFVNGQAAGAMSGYGWAALGRKDMLTSPTCGGKPITADTPCASTINWSASSGLCVDGTLPALPLAASATDYGDNWGILFSANASLEAGGTLGQSYRTLTLNLTGTPLTGLRALVHRKWDQDSFNYCATLIPGMKLAFTAFNSSCWDGRGTQLASTDVPDIDWIGVQVCPSTTATQVSNLCLISIFFE
jgi:hypothetical protein